MSTQRRQFLKTASMFAMAMGMPALGTKIAAASTSTDGTVTNAIATDIFKKKSFLPHLNTTFRVGSGSSAMDLKLVSVTDLRDEVRHPRQVRGRETFSLVFQSAGNAAELSDNVYNLQHAALGTFPMFLVGIGKNHGPRKYEAAVNRF